VRGTPSNGVFGPDLTHLMSRSTLGAGAVRNTPARASFRPDHELPKVIVFAANAKRSASQCSGTTVAVICVDV